MYTHCCSRSFANNSKQWKQLTLNYSFFQGPETESSAVIHDGNKVVVFIGNERPGSISIYSFHGDMTRATFESIYWDIPNTAETWQQSFDQRSITAIDPEDIRYLSRILGLVNLV